LNSALSSSSDPLSISKEGAIAESKKMAEKQGAIGPRSILGWELEDVPDDGNCFYLAVVKQLEHLDHPFISEIPKGTQGNDSLRLRIQGDAFKDREWADYLEVMEASKKLNVIVAIVDTRVPSSRLMYYYRDNEGRDIYTQHRAEISSSVAVVKLAYTGNHYLSVTNHPTNASLASTASASGPLPLGTATPASHSLLSHPTLPSDAALNTSPALAASVATVAGAYAQLQNTGAAASTALTAASTPAYNRQQAHSDETQVRVSSAANTPSVMNVSPTATPAGDNGSPKKGKGHKRPRTGSSPP